MQVWRPDVLAAIATRLGLAFDDLSPPLDVRVRTQGGLEIAALDWGGDRPPAVLLHGGSLTARTWDHVALTLRRGFRVVAPDLRGHGESDWADDYPIEGYVVDVRAVLDGLGLGRVHLAGMSLGGLAACEFALVHPDRVETLAMVDIGARVTVESSARMREFIGGFAGAETVEEVVQMAMAISPLSDPERVRYRMASLLRRGPDGRLVWKSDPRHAEFERIVDRLRSLEGRVDAFPAPFLLAHGGRSRIISADAARAFAARFPDGRTVEIADAGHNVQEDNPRVLAEALRTFWISQRATRTTARVSAIVQSRNHSRK